MSKVLVVDDDAAVRHGLAALLESAEHNVECFASAEDFLANYVPGPSECLLLDMRMPVMSGLELQIELERRDIQIPLIFLTAYGDVPTTVMAMKGGAVDFLTKPIDPKQLLECVRTAIRLSEERNRALMATQQLRAKGAQLTTRERQVLELVVAGRPNKQIALELQISARTVESHRAELLRKTGARSVVELTRIAEALDSE